MNSKSKFQPMKFMEPMKARLAQSPPQGDEWIYEIKFDGFRALAFKEQKNVRLLSRNEKSFADKFPEIIKAVVALKINDVVLDGEIVALDENGISSFQLLQAFELGQQRPPIYFYVFDLVRCDGKDWRDQPLLERKRQLEKLLGKNSGLIRYSASLGEDVKTS